MSSTPLSILDRANTRLVGGTPVDASTVFGEVTARAQAAERLGYERFWVAEHHSVPGIVGSTPTLLLGHLAQNTTSIHLGTGGIMVPSHQPLVIAEQIGTLQSLYGSRIEIGLGASVGFTKPVRTALRQDADAKERFTDDVQELVAYLDGTGPVTAYPQDHSQTQLHILTGGGSALFAAEHGMGLVLGGPEVSRGLAAAQDRSVAVERYREHFVPSSQRDQAPHVIASINVAVAETEQAARDLILSEAWALTQSRSTGVFGALEDPEMIPRDNLSTQQRRRLDSALQTSIYGTPETVVHQLEAVLEFTQADEVLVTGNMWDPAAQRASDALLMQTWQNH